VTIKFKNILEVESNFDLRCRALPIHQVGSD
jgi:hypothetical protein